MSSRRKISLSPVMVTRLTFKTLRLKCTNDELICLAFKHGLLIWPLYIKLCWYPATLSYDMWKVMRDFIAAEDNSKRKVEQDTPVKRVPKDRPQDRGSQNMFDRINKEKMESKVNPFQLTSLIRSWAEFLNQHKDLLHPPPQLQTLPIKRNISKWFDFHNDHGHHTETSKDLMQ